MSHSDSPEFAIFRERYVQLLLAKVEGADQLDSDLLDRVERVIGLEPSYRRPHVSRAPSRRRPRPGDLEVEQIIQGVAEHFQIAPDDLTGPSREQPICTARQLAMRLTREMTGMPYAEVGRAFDRDHATVMHACEVTAGMAVGDVKSAIEELASR